MNRRQLIKRGLFGSLAAALGLSGGKASEPQNVAVKPRAAKKGEWRQLVIKTTPGSCAGEIRINGELMGKCSNLWLKY